jgi:hypothetical protein
MLTKCPRCESPLTLHEGPQVRPLKKTVHGYEHCKRTCETCRIALSNSPFRPTFIRRDWRDGLWRPETADRLRHVVQGTLNTRSRGKKLKRLASERSEDLLTWNVFSWLEDRGLLGEVLRVAGLGKDPSEIKIFYWGSNDRYQLDLDLRALLQTTFVESPDYLSEPDLILVGHAWVAIIEAKFGSPNDVQRGKDMAKYVDQTRRCFDVECQKVQETGYYELTRYWAIGNVLAERLEKQFALINLISGRQGSMIEERFGGLVSGPSIFKRVTWEQLAPILDATMRSHLRDVTLYFKKAFRALE